MVKKFMSDEHKKSVLKTISWRIIATFTTMSLVYIFTGQLLVVVSVGFFEVFGKLILYYLHERFWNKISWGLELKEVRIARSLKKTAKKR